jgi:dihydroorotate dehydrogenase (fumarate)
MHIKEDTLGRYLDLIKDAKHQTLIPIIASINCITSHEWTDFSKRIEQAGADALELNIFLNPTDDSDRSFEDIYIDIATKVANKVSIPVSIKISQYFTKPAKVIKALDKAGVAGITLFNRFFSPDIDIDKQEITQASQYSADHDYYNVLRWVALMSKKVKCDVAATTGIHSAEIALKQILAGAKAVQVASVLYKEGVEYTVQLLKDMEDWMEKNNYNHLSQLQGKLSQESIKDPAAYERMQFMKYFSGME